MVTWHRYILGSNLVKIYKKNCDLYRRTYGQTHEHTNTQTYKPSDEHTCQNWKFWQVMSERTHKFVHRADWCHSYNMGDKQVGHFPVRETCFDTAGLKYFQVDVICICQYYQDIWLLQNHLRTSKYLECFEHRYVHRFVKLKLDIEKLDAIQIAYNTDYHLHKLLTTDFWKMKTWVFDVIDIKLTKQCGIMNISVSTQDGLILKQYKL